MFFLCFVTATDQWLNELTQLNWLIWGLLIGLNDSMNSEIETFSWKATPETGGLDLQIGGSIRTPKSDDLSRFLMVRWPFTVRKLDNKFSW